MNLKKAQITFEALLAFLIFLATLSTLTLFVLGAHGRLSGSFSSTSRANALSSSSLDAGIIYSSTNCVHLDSAYYPKKLNYNQNIISTSQNEFAYTVNPSVYNYEQLKTTPN
jgi:hypothetical protein